MHFFACTLLTHFDLLLAHFYLSKSPHRDIALAHAELPVLSKANVEIFEKCYSKVSARMNAVEHARRITRRSGRAY